MRIIKQGQIKGPPTAEVKCRECDTVFECTAAEGEYVSDPRDGPYVKLNCPYCKVEITVAFTKFHRS